MCHTCRGFVSLYNRSASREMGLIGGQQYYYLYCSEGEAEETEEDACEAGDFLLGIGLAEDENAIEEGNDRAAAADGGDDGYHRIGVAQRQHIDIVGQDQEHGNAGDGSRIP